METCPRCGEGALAASRFCRACGAPLSDAPAAGERRKVVTVVFADVVGSTALGERVDSETLRWAMRRWFDRMRVAVERHGGTVENYIGDAVMAVFGIPVAHEDDALRAVRAAVDMREETVALRGELLGARAVELTIRIGVNTGEAVTGAGAGVGSFTAGDTVNVAARFEQAAPAGEILIAGATFRLVRHAVDAEPVAPLIAKGKSAALEAYRLEAVDTDAWGRAERPRAPMVGRQRERRRMLDAFHQAVADRSCQLFTVLGAAGVGKSRLVAEVLETIDGQATVAAGRCLPYGDGLTWWPLVEAFGAAELADASATDDEGAGARVAELLKATGEPIAPAEAFWAVRKVLEAHARQRPVVLIVDDLQWAEPTFIDLIEHLAEWSRDAPLLVLIMARNELLELRPGWGGGKLNATTVLLEPLPEADARDLLHHLAGPALIDARAESRILAIAEGNPLFVQEVVAMLIDDGVLVPDGGGAPLGDLTTIAVPPTIQALIAARLDRLAADERKVIEAASIEGKEFTRGGVAALVGDATDRHMLALVRKDLVRPAIASEGPMRFRHQLIRDVTYEAMSKVLRADMHERFADWLGATSASLPIADELVGYHLERAVVLRRELGATEAATAELAARACARLRAAGRRATLRDDPAAVSLIERAWALAPEADRAPLLVELADAFNDAGDLERCAATATAALELASATGDRRAAARARTVRLRLRFDRWEGESGLASLNAEATSVLDELEDLGDDEGMTAVLILLGHLNVNHFERSCAYFERALAVAERTGGRRDAAFAAGSLGLILVYGPIPADEAIARCRTLRVRVADHRVAAATLLRHEAVLRAMQGFTAEARTLFDEYRRIIDDLGNAWASGNVVFGAWQLEMLAGEPERAAATAREGLDILEAIGAKNEGSTAAALLAVALVRLGLHEEALRYADLAASWAAPDDVASQVGQLTARAHVLAARGDLSAAQATAREAVRSAERSDDISQHGDALVDLATILDRAGRADEALAALHDALSLYERKGNVVGAGRARTLLGVAR